MDERTIRKHLAALRRLRPSGTTNGLRAQVRHLSEQFGEMADSMKRKAKPASKREEMQGRDRQEQGGQDRSNH